MLREWKPEVTLMWIVLIGYTMAFWYWVYTIIF